MTGEKIFRCLRDIDPQLIADAAPDVRQSKKSSGTWIKRASLVACLALLALCVPTLIHIFLPSEVDDPRAGTVYEFGSYAELCGALPSDSIIANIPNIADATITATAICPEGTTDFANYDNYSYLNVDVCYADGTGVNIWCTFKSEKTAAEYVESRPLTYPPDGTSVTTVYGYDVYCAAYLLDSAQIYTAVFSIDDTLYELTSDTLSRDALVGLVGDMLK